MKTTLLFRPYMVPALILQMIFSFSLAAQSSDKVLQSPALLFIENRGQLIDRENRSTNQIPFYAVSEGTRIYFAADRITYVFREESGKSSSDQKGITSEVKVSMILQNSNPQTRIIASEKSSEFFNFFYPHLNPGIANVPAFKKLVYENIYPEIDLVLYSGEKGIKYDFVVHPGGDPEQISMHYEGASRAYISKEGRLIVQHLLGNLEEEKPYTYQQIEGEKATVGSQFILKSDNTVGFKISNYDSSRDLIIDPFATYYGGSSYEVAKDLATDAAGNIYITGNTGSYDFPVQSTPAGYNQNSNAGGYDGFIVKFNSNGVRQWSTYFGGSDYEEISGIGVNSNGDIALTGYTYSEDLPVKSAGGYQQNSLNGYQDAFVAKFSTNGALLWSTYLGGGEDEESSDIAVDENGNVIVTGSTYSADFPIQSLSGAYNQTTQAIEYGSDAFITRFTSNGSLNWSTYYGGMGVESPTGICIDGSGNIFLTGYATIGLPLQTLAGAYNQTFQATTNNYFDLFVIKFSNNGTRLWSTYYGGSSEDIGGKIATDSEGNILLTGSTKSTNFPLKSLSGAYNQASNGGGLSDIIIAKFAASGALTWATYYGGTGDDNGLAIASDPANNIIIGGSSKGGGLPTQEITGGYNQLNGSAQGDFDGFILKFNSTGVRQWATYYGGSDGDDEIAGIAGDASGSVVATGFSESLLLPVIGNPGGYTQGKDDYGTKAILVQLTGNGALATGTTPQTITFNELPDRNYSDYFTLSASASSNLPVTFSVTGPAEIYDGNQVYITGIGTVSVTATQNGNSTYSAAEPVTRTFCVRAPQPYSITANPEACLGINEYTTTNITGAIYNWSVPIGDSIISTTENKVAVNWKSTGVKILTVNLSSDCGVPGTPLSKEITVIETPELGIVSGLLPTDGSNNLMLPLTFSWDSVSNAVKYDLYVWEASFDFPYTRATNITDTFRVITSGLNYGIPYKWKIAAKSVCGQKESVVQTFTLNCITPSQPSEISGPAESCLGEATYHVNYQSGVNYNWEVTGPNTLSGASSFAFINWTTPGTYTITVTPSVSCKAETGPSRTLLVTVADKPVPGQVSQMLPTHEATGISYPVNLSWSLAENAAKYDVYIWKSNLSRPSSPYFSNLDTSGKQITYGLEYGESYNWQVVSKNECHQTEGPVQTFTLNCITPEQPSPISGPQEVCPGKENYSIPGLDGIIYTWTTDGDGVISGTGSSVSVTWGNPGSYTLTVTPSVSCGLQGPSRTLSVQVLNIPEPGMVSGMEPTNGTDTLTLPFDLTWSASSNTDKYDLYLWEASEARPSYPFKEDISTTTYRVVSGIEPGVEYNWQIISHNTCKSKESPVQTLKLLCTTPDEIASIDGLTDVCPGEVTYSVPAQFSINYEWSVTGDNTISGSGNLIKVDWKTTGSYELTVIPVAVCGARGTGKTIQIIVKEPVNPSPVTGMQPTEGAINARIPVTFAWNESANATRYDLYVWKASMSSRPTSPLTANIEESAYTYKGDIDNDVLYKWQVIAKNNCRETAGPVQTFKTIPLPDLEIISYDLPSGTTGGTSLTVSWEVKNSGKTSTGTAQWTDKIYLSNDRDLRKTDDILLGSFPNVTYLQPGSSYRQVQEVTMPSTPGTYYIFIITDNTQANCTGVLTGDSCSIERNRGADNVLESNEENNHVFKALNITAAPAADLSVISVGAPTDVFNGSSFNVIYQVKNVGEANAVGKRTYASGVIPTVSVGTGGSAPRGSVGRCYDHYWNDMLYLSKDESFSPEEDIYIGYSFVSLRSKTQRNICMDFAEVPLVIDSTYSMTTEVNLPPKYTGEFYILVVAAHNEGVDEAQRYGNNVKASEKITITLAPPPDLEVTSLSPPAAAEAGKEAPFSFTVSNVGGGAPHKSESLWFDEIYLSKSSTFIKDSAVSILKTYQGMGSKFRPDTSYTVSKNIRIPEGLAGDYYMYVYTDEEDKVFEHTFNSNNLKRSNFPIPVAPGAYADLATLEVEVADTIYAERPFEINWKVKNEGIGKITAAHYDAVYFAKDSVWNPSYVIDQKRVLTVLEPGQTELRTSLVTAPDAVGDGWFYVMSDFSGNIFENGSESNNLKISKKVYIKYAPLQSDLIVRQVKIPEIAQAGAEVTIEYTVHNEGNDNSKVSTWSDGIYLSSDTILDASDKALLVKSFRNSVLGPSGFYSVTTNAAIPAGISGNYYLFIVADANGVVPNESTRLNNIRRTQVNISATPSADLVVTRWQAPAEAFAGQKIKVYFTIKNQGGTPARSIYNDVTYWSDGIWLGLDPALSSATTKIQVGSYLNRKTIGVDQSISDSVEITLPDYLNGNYFLFVKADNQNWVFEHDKEDNNLSFASPLTITPAAPADLVVKKLNVTPNAYLGDTIQTSYSIANIGTEPAIGNLRNNVSLSKNIILEPNQDVLLDFNTEPVNIAPGDSIVRTLQSVIPGVVPDTYHGIIHTNATNSVSETNTDNNIGLSNGTVTVRAKTLFLDVAEQVKLSPKTKLYYEVKVQADLDLLLTLTSDQIYGLNEVYVAYNRIPTSADFDYRYDNPNRPNQKVLVPGTRAGSYFIMVTTSLGYSGSQNINLLAKALPFSILTISPNRLGQGSVSTVLNGAGFRPGIQVVLRNGGIPVANATVEFVNSMQLKLRWNLTATPKGVYDLVAINPDNAEVMLAKGVTVEAASQYTIDYIPQAPGLLRKGKSGFYTFTFKNISNIDIPVLHGDFTILAQSEVIEVLKVEGKIVTGSDFPVHPEIPGTDYTEAGSLKLIPFITKNLAPEEQITIALNLGIKDFTYNTFPLSVRLKAYDLDYYLERMNEDMEIVRQAILADPAQVNAHLVPGLAELATNRRAFVDTMMVPLFRTGLLIPSDTIGFDFACNDCLHLDLLEREYPDGDPGITFNYDPGASPGTTTLPVATFAAGEDYLWEINHYNGTAGAEIGWDLIKVQGEMKITATPESPFIIRISSIDEENYPGYLSGWYPAVDKSWPIAIADGGITGFNPAKFSIDTSRFVAYNYTYGGKFSVKMQGSDTLLLQFTARIPKPGEAGTPGAPGGWGQPGSPGGQGGPGNESTPAGPGGPGGAGGPGGPGGPSGGTSSGGQGGSGGTGGTGPGGTGPEGPNGPTGIIDPGPETPPPGVPPTTPPRKRPGSRPKGPGSHRNSKYYAPPKPRQPLPDEDKPQPENPPCNETQTSSDACNKAFDISANGAKAYIASGKYKNYARLSEGINAGSNFIQNCYVKTIVVGVADALGGTVNALDAKKFNPVLSLNIAANAIKFTVGITMCAETNERVKQRGQMIIDAITCINSSSGMELLINVGACIGKQFFCTNILSSCDPNEIIGPLGYGPDKMVAASQPMAYKVTYENDSALATTAAQRVKITVPVDPHLNPLSFRLGSFGFGKFNFDVPANTASYFNTLDLPDSVGYDVQVTAGVDIIKNELFWIFQTVDPKTGLSPANPLLGYLLINDSLGNGEGYVTYSIKPKNDVVTGDTVKARATIVFDTNDPILTNQAQNLLDAVAPVSRINTLPTQVDSVAAISVNIQDDRRGSGVSAYDLYISQNGGPYNLAAKDQNASKAFDFKGDPGSNYCFFSIGKDNTGNAEPMKTKGDVCLSIKGDNSPITLLQPNGNEHYCAGAEVKILWLSQGVNSVDLYYSPDEGQSFLPIIATQPANGEYIWILPASLESAGTYLIKAVDSDSDLNADTSDQTFTIGNAAQVVAGSDETVCQSAPAFTIAGYSPTGGSWSGKGVNSLGLFDPRQADQGVNVLSYTITINNCPTTVTKKINVTSGPSVTLAPFNPVSVNTPAFALTGGNPAGGHYTGMGVSDGLFDPSVTNAGSFNITYTYTENNGCTGSASQLLVVNGDIATPTNLKASAKSSDQIDLNWADQATNETAYLVERSSDPVDGFTIIGTLAANSTSYEDKNLFANTTYYYRVKAVNNSNGSSGYSNVAGATTAPNAVLPQLEQSTLISLYPNIVSDKFTIEYHPIHQTGKVNLTIHSVQGVILNEKVLKPSGADYREVIDASALPAGIYFLRILDNGTIHYKSFIKD